MKDKLAFNNGSEVTISDTKGKDKLKSKHKHHYTEKTWCVAVQDFCLEKGIENINRCCPRGFVPDYCGYSEIVLACSTCDSVKFIRSNRSKK